MNCIIIEDEQNAVEYLELMLRSIDPHINVQAKIGSVSDAVKWLKQYKTDLIFLDVNLGDDVSFSIFDEVHVTTPVIFTTAHDNHAIEAFRLNSISYLLKPFDRNELEDALFKFNSLQPDRSENKNIYEPAEGYQKRFLVSFGNNNMKFLTEDDIAFFHIDNKYLFVTCPDGKQYLFYGTMDSLEHKLDPEKFFRINRKYIISINSIREMQTLSRGRISIDIIPEIKEEIIVSVDRAPDFRKWLNH